MRKTTLTTTAIAALILAASFSAPAYATGGEGGEGGEGGGDHTCQGGHNCNVGGGGNVGDIKNTNTNVNANFNKNDVDVDVDNKNTNINANFNKNDNYNRNSNKQSQDQDQHQAQGQIQGQAQQVNDSGNANVNIENERPPVNTAYSAALATSEDTCMGSSSIGGQAVSFGLTIGTTWTDDNCQRLKNSRQLVALGYHRAATALMCFDESVSQAMIQAGTPCPSGAAAAVYVAPPAREYAPMAPVADERPARKRRVRKALPPK